MDELERLLLLLPAAPRLLVLDFDGVLTDNAVYVDDQGNEAVRCSKEDSLGLSLLRRHGFALCILSTETNAVVQQRAAKLKVSCISGATDKTAALRTLLAERRIDAADVVFVGNDVNDLGCLREVGCGLVVADAHRSVLAAAKGVLSRPGGHGAVREVCDAILHKLGLDGHWNDTDRQRRQETYRPSTAA